MADSDVLVGFSRGMYANWLWHRPLQLLIDAGEGLQLALGANVFAPNVIAVTHGHSDHVLGLAGIAAARRFGKGAVDKPYTVLYPAHSPGVEGVRRYLDSVYAGVTFPITWTPVQPGHQHPLGKNLVLEAFGVTHLTGPEQALGYRVLETRRRLKPEHAGLSRDQVAALAREGRRDELMEGYTQVTFVHSGDAMPIDPSLAADASILVHDATFLEAADRRELIHATTEEALAVAAAARVDTLVLHHLSVRYDRAAALPRLRDQVQASGFDGRCLWLDDGRIEDLRA